MSGRWSDWADHYGIDKPGWMHSDTRVQVKNIDDEILGTGGWEITAGDCEWSEITAYRYWIEDDKENPTKQTRYLDSKGDDWIDEFARTATVDEFRGAMKFTIGKYLRRVGKKDDIPQELGKIRDYAERWKEYESKL